METNDILIKFNESLEKVLSAQNSKQSNKYDWVKIVVGLLPFIITGIITISVAFSRLESKIEESNKSIRSVATQNTDNINQIKIDENSRANKVDYNFGVIQQKHPELRFIPTTDVK